PDPPVGESSLRPDGPRWETGKGTGISAATKRAAGAGRRDMDRHDRRVGRREALRRICGAGAVAAASLAGAPTGNTRACAAEHLETTELASAPARPAAETAQVGFVKTSDRVEGTRRALGLISTEGFAGKRVLLKPNFNSADPAPGSTHPDT